MNVPANLYCTPKTMNGFGSKVNTAYVGVTDFAQGELGDIVFIEIETLGRHLKKKMFSELLKP